MPLKDSAEWRWLRKSVEASQLLDDVEGTNQWSHAGPGSISLTSEQPRRGQFALRLQSPTRTGIRGAATSGRPFGEAVARRHIDGEDWTMHNRISFWVRPHLPGFKTISMLVKLHNDGATKVPDRYGREGLNFFLLRPDEWNQIVWEIPYLARDRVVALEFIYRLQGHEPGATNIVTYDIDQIELQRVQADPYEGWMLPADTIVFSHAGYQIGSSKTAIAGKLTGKDFKVIQLAAGGGGGAGGAPDLKQPLPVDKGKTILTKPLKAMTTPLGDFVSLDFSDLLQPGLYVIKAGEVVTKPFPVHDNIWLESISKTLSFFAAQRCGVAVTGVHDICHADWQATRDGETIRVNGGWHDAGDLSQGLVNTAEAVHAMLLLNERLQASQPALAARAVEEAKWGLEWILKTRFSSGQRVIWGTMDFWTDGLDNTDDDMLARTGRSPFDLMTAATAEAAAARIMKSTDPDLAAKSLTVARADWDTAAARLRGDVLEQAAAGVLAALELFRVTGEQAYANRASTWGASIVECQQRTPGGFNDLSLGFFYTQTNRLRLQHYSHRGHEQAPIVALAGLCELFPQHENWMKWYSAVVLHAEYLRASSAVTAPYHMLPASIYDLRESSDETFQAQVKQGINVGEHQYLRRFPVWTELRGNNGVLLSRARALSVAAHLRGEISLSRLAEEQLQWIVGRNPFGQSMMFGVGHNFPPLYSAMSGQMVGALPVGIQTRQNQDAPYWPAANCYNYKEVWVHPATRWLALMTDLAGFAQVLGETGPGPADPVEFTETSTGTRYVVKPEKPEAKFSIDLPAGDYTIRQAHLQTRLRLLPGEIKRLNLRTPLDLTLSTQFETDGRLRIKLKAEGSGPHRFDLRLHNLAVPQREAKIDLKNQGSETVTWLAAVTAGNEPWLVVVVPDETMAGRLEAYGKAPKP